MSHNRRWNGRRHDRQNQNDRHYGHLDASYLGYDNSYAQPAYYAHDSNSNAYYCADAQPSHGYAQPSHGYNYWRDHDAYYAPNQHQSPIDYSSSNRHGHGHRHADDDAQAERPYRRQRQRRQRSDSPHRQYHTRAEGPASSTPYIVPPSLHWRTPATAPAPAQQAKSPSPPPPPPAEPDPAYLTLSLEPSHIINYPRTSRKLLILDLNGTLLIRSQHNPRTRQKVAHGGNHNNGQAPRLRAVQPRPYIPAFRAYIFAPETREWLDTMVWSSAQPHSVADMVGKVFGDAQSKLVAVWDRESLGLSKEDYFRKSQTTKDLTKPWTLLPLGTTSAEPAAQFEADSTAEKTGLAPSVTHSAMTTLLLDDSPAKARLQPYNHVCIPEYDSSLRVTDLRRFEREKIEAKSMVALLPTPPTDNELLESRSKAQGLEMRTPRKQKEHARPMPERTKSADISSSSSDSDLSVVESTPAPVEQSFIPILPTERARISSRPGETYDPTLLAVIGILDEIKKQSSVAGWIRGGGLWDIIAAVPAAEEEINSAAPASDASLFEDPAPPTSRAAKRLAKTESRMMRQLAEKQRTRAGKGAKAVIQMTGNDESSIADVPGGNMSEDAGAQHARMWFSDEDALAYWVGRGRSALESLGIEATHGITG